MLPLRLVIDTNVMISVCEERKHDERGLEVSIRY